jgi:hypothetical protein
MTEPTPDPASSGREAWSPTVRDAEADAEGRLHSLVASGASCPVCGWTPDVEPEER